jgi:prephenate dehydrogenase
MGTTLGSALSGVFGAVTSGIGGGNGQIPEAVRTLIASAESYYKQGVAALKNEDLATYSADMQIVGNLIAEAQSELKKAEKVTSTKVVKDSAIKAVKATTSGA